MEHQGLPAGAWTVLDWERGELTGIPGWDWFHYVIQSGILVGRLATSGLGSAPGVLLRSEAFQQYAARGGIIGCERELALAYCSTWLRSLSLRRAWHRRVNY